MKLQSEVLIGCAGFGAEGQRCVSQLGLMEVQETFIAPPKRLTLERWRRLAPEGFVYSLRAWQLIAYGADTPGYSLLPERFRMDSEQCGRLQLSKPVLRAYQTTVECAATLGAEAIVFDTPVDFTPTSSNRDRLRRFFREVRRPQGVTFVWEPRGIWSAEEVDGLSSELDMVGCWDPIIEHYWPAGEVGYVKLRGASYHEGNMQELWLHAARYRRLYVVVCTGDPVRDALRFSRSASFA